MQTNRTCKGRGRNHLKFLSKNLRFCIRKRKTKNLLQCEVEGTLTCFLLCCGQKANRKCLSCEFLTTTHLTLSGRTIFLTTQGTHKTSRQSFKVVPDWAPIMWLEAILESLWRNTLLNRPQKCPQNKVSGPMSSQSRNVQGNKPSRKRISRNK